MSPDPIFDTKKRLRSAARLARAEAFRRHGAEAGQRIAGHGIAFAGIAPPALVSGFLPIGEEIDPLPLLEKLASAGFGLALPVMTGKGAPLLFRAWKPQDALTEVTWGIREPLASAPEIEPDIVLAPLLAFDAQGYRLGYGGGFYDRTLARLRSAKEIIAIGIAYDEQRVDTVPHHQYDQRLDWVLTPSGPLRCEGCR